MTTLRILAGLALAAAAFGQMRDNQEKQLTCDSRSYDDRGRSCDVREQSTAAVGLLNVDAGRNGGATIKGWTRGDVLVRTRVEGWGATDAEAKALASQVLIDTSGGRVQARGPESLNNSGWSVSFEIFVPQATSLTVKTVNGGINVSDVRGNLHFEANNGAANQRKLRLQLTSAGINRPRIQANMEDAKILAQLKGTRTVSHLRGSTRHATRPLNGRLHKPTHCARLWSLASWRLRCPWKSSLTLRPIDSICSS